MKIIPLASLLSAALLAPAALGQGTNLLTNPSFENGGLTGWSFFGPNVYAELAAPPAIAPRTGSRLVKIYGHFSGAFNVSGIYQSFPASPGQVYTMDCWTRHWSGDPMTGFGPPNDNWAVMKIAFFNSGGTEVGGAERLILDGNAPQNTWINNAPISGTAPAGTTQVQALILFLQPGVAGGSAQFDDIEFYGPPAGAAYPGTREDLILASAVGTGTPTWGPGNDIKTAASGNTLHFNVSSPGNAFILKPYVLVAALFPTATPPSVQPGYPGIWFPFNGFFALVNGLIPTPIGSPVIGPNGGSSTFLVVPQGMPPGLSVMLQGLVIDPSTANTIYAATDGHELRF